MYASICFGFGFDSFQQISTGRKKKKREGNVEVHGSIAPQLVERPGPGWFAVTQSQSLSPQN